MAREFAVSVSTVSYWVERAGGQRLDRVDFSNGKTGRAWNRTSRKLERKIVLLRSQLRNSVLGEIGADAIANALRKQSDAGPSRATINRVLERRGLHDRTPCNDSVSSA